MIALLLTVALAGTWDCGTTPTPNGDIIDLHGCKYVEPLGEHCFDVNCGPGDCIAINWIWCVPERVCDKFCVTGRLEKHGE